MEGESSCFAVYQLHPTDDSLCIRTETNVDTVDTTSNGGETTSHNGVQFGFRHTSKEGLKERA
jgi:hypothetical protein